MLLTSFFLGFLGSLHCLGMCSPLVIAVTHWRTPFFINRVIYNVARITSYGLQGAIISALGSLFDFTGFQTMFSLFLGIILLFIGTIGVTNFKMGFISLPMRRFTNLIKNLFTKFLQRRDIYSFSVLGFLNGLLPCGLTYLALSYCVILPNFNEGFFFMFFFGLGTFPVMLGFTSIAQFLIKKYSFNFQKITVVALLSAGIILTARGLSHYSAKSHAANTITVCQPR
jgi:sulfite exporter TauE/SafE